MKSNWRGLSPTVWALGAGSLLMDWSSELVHSVLPLFMVTVLGSSMEAVGWVEGVAEATAAITKIFSGVWSDRLGRRKGLLVSGYAMAALTKPLFPLANSLAWVLAARFFDRVGKGIRGAPRDALVADITPPERRGAAYGMRQALDSVGAFLGPLTATLLLVAFHGSLQRTMWFAVIPAVLTVIVLARFVREPEQHLAAAQDKAPHWRAWRELPLRLWGVVALGVAFTLARFSEAFLVLRAQSVGMALAWVPLVMVAMNVVYAAASYPAGGLSDRLGARRLLQAGMLTLVAADGVLGAGASAWGASLGAMLWGLQMALTQGVLSKLVADTAPPWLRGTAFGVFNLASGVALLLASGGAGWLWERHGPAATFGTGAVLALGAALATLALPGIGRRAAASPQS
jgi:MFS family permease